MNITEHLAVSKSGLPTQEATLKQSKKVTAKDIHAQVTDACNTSIRKAKKLNSKLDDFLGGFRA